MATILTFCSNFIMISLQKVNINCFIEIELLNLLKF